MFLLGSHPGQNGKILLRRLEEIKRTVLGFALLVNNKLALVDDL